MNILCWLWPLLAGLICGILGYLIGRMSSKNLQEKCDHLTDELEKCKKHKKSSLGSNVASGVAGVVAASALSESNEKELKNKISVLESSMSNLRSSKAKLESDLEACNTKNKQLELAVEKVSLVPFNAAQAKAVFGKKVNQDDLKIVEGIGPKIEGLFHSFGIKTWKALSETSVEKCQEVLNSGGERYRTHVPTTWSRQAEMAYQGQWEALLKWQDELDGGKE